MAQRISDRVERQTNEDVHEANSKTVTISPNIPTQLKDECFSISRLAVTNDISIDINIDHGEVRYSVSDDSVKVVVESN